ncbi:MAG TPA: L-2-hydroxyglutarate oxidase [Baekduia sp.]|nr:L-2-hydroxyglutarate oxidase [Baekduia sp.]
MSAVPSHDDRTEVNHGYDVAIVGGGILGLATARALLQSQPRLKVIVLERERELAAHQTGHNSGVIHAGIYYEPGSLKARLCVSGARKMYAFCEEHGIAVERCGKLIVASSPDELQRLGSLETRGRANGVPGLRRLTGGEIADVEPHCIGVGALHSPATGIVDYAEVARRLASDARARGAEIVTGHEVTDVEKRARGVRLTHRHGALDAHHAIFCAGAWSDRLAVRAGAPSDPRIVPFRGQYLKLREGARALVKGMIYPVPDPSLPFLGVHLTRQINGDVVLGPTALLSGSRAVGRISRVAPRDLMSSLSWPGTWKMGSRFWRAGVSEVRLAASRRAFVAACRRYVPEIALADVEDGFAGVRAQAVDRRGRLVDDFVFSETDTLLHVRNAPSPAATSSLAIGESIAERAANAFSLV